MKDTHAGLASSVGDSTLINKLIDKHVHLLFAKKNFMLDIEFEKFMIHFWCEYLFGPKVNPDAFQKTREKLITAMRYGFYNNTLKNLPVLGELTCRFYGWMKGVEFKQVDAELLQYIGQADSGLIRRFEEKLTFSKDFTGDVTQALLDNTFDLILVFDFLHNALYETLALIVKNKLDDDRRRDQYAPALRSAFLFPFRARVAQQPIKIGDHVIAQGSHVYVNLLKSGFYHSYGPRACIGAGVTSG